MSKTIITADMVDPDDPNAELLIGATILSGEDKPTIGTVFQSVEDATVVKSLRLPGSLYDAAVRRGHPNGFSGVVREALEAHLKYVPEQDEVKHALAVIQAALKAA